MTHATASSDQHAPDAARLINSPAADRILAWVDRHRRWIFTAIVVLYLAGFTGKWRVAPDSGLYMSLGRSLAEGEGFVYHGETHTRYEPGLPLVISASYRLFGQDRYAPLLVFILACTFTSLWLSYRLMLRHAGRPTAVLVTALFAVCETCLRYGFQIVTDTPFLVALLVYLLAYERLVGRRTTDREHPPTRRRWLDGVAWPALAASTVVMSVFRPTIITFVGAVGLATAWHLLRGPGRLRHALIGLLTLGCFLGFRAVDPRRQHAGAPAREQRLKELLTTQRDYALERIATVTVPDFVEEILPEAVFGVELGTGLDTIASLVIMGAGIALFRRNPLWGAWTAATFAQCMFWLPRERYLLPVLPMLIYALWRGTCWLTARPSLSPRAAAIVLACVGAVYLGPNLVKDVAFLVEQRHVGIDGSGAGDPQFAPYLQMAREIRDRVGEGDMVLATDHYELSYFSRRRVEESPWSLRWPPTEQQQREFFEKARAAPAIYAVLPDTNGKPVVEGLIEKLGMRPGEAVARVDRPPDEDGDAQPPLTLHRLERAGGTTMPTTTAVLPPATP
jgi:hypothetical protein